MGKLKVTDFLIYRWRYPLGYALFFISVVTFLVLAGLFVPGGLSKYEISSALISDGLNPNMLLSLEPKELMFLPYRLFQAASISLFGFNEFAIKLPSIILAALSAIGLLALLSMWFRKNVAIIGSIMAVSMGQFMLVAQSGHAGITYVFWSVSILLTASLIVRRGKYAPFWTVVAFVLSGLSLYMPLNIYVILALILTTIVHPHARHILMRQTSKAALIIGSMLFMVIITPLVIGIIHDTQVLFELLGIPSSWPAIVENGRQIFHQYAGFYRPRNGLILQPVYSMGSLLLILLGLYQMFSTKYTTKSYIISFWLLFLLPFVLLNPSSVSVTFVPVALLLTQGIDYLIRSWYSLFPRNPYARVFGLLPLAVLVVGITVSNVDRYAYGFHYNEAAYIDYTYDLKILSRKLRTLPANQKVTVLSTPAERPMYEAFALHERIVLVLDVETNANKALQNSYVLATHDAKPKVSRLPDGVLAWKMANDGDRFYLYKKSSS